MNDEMDIDNENDPGSSNQKEQGGDENLNLCEDEEGGLRVDDDIYIPPSVKPANKIDKDGPRLMISKIVNHNFKSYAGTQVIGPFHKCFSAIIGPNGSGKSNIIDSMLFVFGYRANKIRSKKISGLLHNSDNNQNITSCTVSIYFQEIIDKPGADFDIVPNSEFIVSRTAFKDSTSYYELNQKRVQFKEIGKCLRSYGVDLDHNRFLILQGEVEQIAMMKPMAQNENDVGMLEFLEDIIGTVHYKEPLQKLSEKIEVLSDYRSERLNRLKIVEKEKEALEEPMQEAVQYLRLENSIKRMQHQLYSFERLQTKIQLTQQEVECKELENNLNDLRNQLKKIHEDRTQKNKIMVEKSAKWAVLQEQLDEIDAKLNKIRKQDESLHAELVETNKRRKANIASLKTEKSKLEELSKVPEKSLKNIEECQTHMEVYITQKQKEEEVLEKAMVELSKKTEPLSNQRSKLEMKLMHLRKDVDQAQAAYDIAKSELTLYTSVESTEKEKLEKLKHSLQLTRDNLKSKNVEMQDLENKIPNSEQELVRAQNELRSVTAKEFELTSKLKRMKISFEEQKSAMQANRSRNRILDSLLREKAGGRIPGVFGRLGDLGAIDAQYDVAISTACGPLDNIVVDTVATAQTCITFLRQNDIGRATFIPLEKQQRLLPKCQQKIQTPENVPRLFDLIRVKDERVLPAFYYGLQDTLVANNLDQATRIAYGQRRFRVVTLKGELIELSGTMSGGGKTVLRGRMGQQVVTSELSAADVEKVQSELTKTHEECNQLKCKSQSLESQVNSLSVELKDMKVKREKLCIEMRTFQEQEPSLLTQTKIQEKKVANSICDPLKVKQLEKILSAAQDALEKVKENSKASEDEVLRINKKIDELSGGLVSAGQKKITQLSKQIEKVKAEICSLQIGIKTAERNVKKVQQRIENLENDVVTCEQRLRKIQTEKQGLEEQAKEYLEEHSKLSEALVERDEATASLKDELNELQSKENKIKALKIDLDQKAKEYKSIIDGLKRKICELIRKVEEITLQPIPHETLEELKELTEEELDTLDETSLKLNLQKAKKRLSSEIPNMQIIQDYYEKDALYLKRAAELEKITIDRNKMRDIYEVVRRRRIQEFLAGFTTITDKLKEMYQMITLGGDAELELVDSLDPFSEGIAFSVRPPKKSWKNICNLSGGEKTLSSLALVFALHHYKPTPLYFMDEIDAALDFKNVSIVANYIKERTKNAQFIIISLRSNMFELADYLVGIYKTYNCTKCVTVDLKRFYEKNGIQPPTQITSQTVCPSQTQIYAIQSHTKDATIMQSKNDDAPYDLPELGLCPTPEKVSLPARRSSSSLDNGNSDKTPARKKRKV